MNRSYWSKWRSTERCPACPPRSQIACAAMGAFFGIIVLAGLADATGASLLMAPFGATAALACAVPDSPLAQPRNIIGGHVLSALIGFLVLHTIGATFLGQSVAVAGAIALMLATGTFHAPAGATPLVVLFTSPDLDFVLMPVLAGSALLVLVALLLNNLVPDQRYPRYWL